MLLMVHYTNLFSYEACFVGQIKEHSCVWQLFWSRQVGKGDLTLRKRRKFQTFLDSLPEIFSITNCFLGYLLKYDVPLLFKMALT